MAGSLVDISADFAGVRRRAFTPPNEEKAVAECTVWLDKLAPWWR